MEAGNAETANAEAADCNVEDDLLVGDDLLSADQIAAIRALAVRQGLSADALLHTARAFKRRALDANGDADANSVMVDPTKSSAPPSLSVRMVVTSVRQRQAVPLPVAPLTDDEFTAISPFLYCRSRTLPRCEMLWRAMQFAMGHANGKSAEDYSVASWLSYETSRHKGKRVRALADAMHGVLSEQRCRELEVLADYVEQRASALERWARERFASQTGYPKRTGSTRR